MREVGTPLEKAERSFAAADLLLDAGDADFALRERTTATFTWRKGCFSRRACDTRPDQEVVAQYGRHFASEGRLDRRYHRFLGRAFELSQLAVDPAVVSELIGVGKEFLEATRDYLGPQKS